jgi:hypothetical protein
MSTAITMVYSCRSCGSTQAVLPPRPNVASIVKCGNCAREHGALGEVRRELLLLARQSAAHKAEKIFRTARRQ